MTTLLRVAGEALVWVLAVVGVLAGGVWIANQAGLVQPLLVVSGSMSPTIRQGDLLFAVRQDVGELEVGEVVTLQDPRVDRLVTHRIVGIDRVGGGVDIRMQGDANGTPDPAPYRVAADARVWHPVLTLPGVGDLVITVSRPVVGIPLVIGLVALVALSVTSGGRRRPGERKAAT
ncbi:signal peptidase I [Protaetiibacter mangrovi]|uniref:Signal peptidase I n=1 Tax=Protaetiibacter mangrovi TaxID=2970926 RepID=A0ABT1ZJ23_9MICO|nr:signal peptidase I [Protaetiibacter mangrovi]MCS0500706.1 signal peptidase I [Protaetiibacter mangrovi]TPW91048.1 signal peptidase I [Schumannella luteola]